MHKKALLTTIGIIAASIVVIFVISIYVQTDKKLAEPSNAYENANESMIDANDVSANDSIIYNADGTIDTSNWQTYRNEEYGFEVRYPKDYVYSEVDGVRFYKKQCEMNKFNICPKGISINTYPNDKNDFIKSWSKECDAFKTVKIRGVKSDVSSCDERLSSNFAQINLYDHIVKYSFVTDNNVFYDIHISYFGSDNIEIENNIFNSISFAHN